MYFISKLQSLNLEFDIEFDLDLDFRMSAVAKLLLLFSIAV